VSAESRVDIEECRGGWVVRVDTDGEDEVALLFEDKKSAHRWKTSIDQAKKSLRQAT